MKRHGKFLHWLRTWDPKGFPNPFYSPSYVAYCAGYDIMQAFVGALKTVQIFSDGMTAVLEEVKTEAEHSKED